MQKTLPSSLLLILGLLFITLNAHAEPMLNGLALHKELGKDQFIGAIYSETLSSEADILLTGQENINMALKITAERGIRLRRFNRMWIEGMAINNSSASLNAQADNMVAFTNLFKGRLLQNDHIVFTATPNNGLDVTLNTIKLGNIPDDSFIKMLLSTWLGRIPLSSDYQEGVLAAGAVDNELFQRFSAIETSEDRIQQIVAWNAPAVPVKVKPKPIVAATVTEAPPEPIDIASTNKLDITLPSLGRESSASSSSIPSTSEDDAPTPSDESIDVVSVDYEEDEEDSNLPAFTVESLLASQRYFSKINILVQRNITYPRRAIKRNHTGNLRIAISLSRDGALLEVAFLEKTTHNSLNNAAMKAISKLTYPKIPDAIPGSTHDFTIPISFQLQ